MSMIKKLSRTAIALLIACGAVAGSHVIAAPDATAEESKSSTTYLGDTVITAKVKTALLANRITGVSVTTEQGVVTLAGTVPTTEMRQKANKIAADVHGVNDVDYTGLLVKADS